MSGELTISAVSSSETKAILSKLKAFKFLFFILAFSLYCPALKVPLNNDLVNLLPPAELSKDRIATIVGSNANADEVLELAGIVYRYFIYDARGHSREPIPPDLKSIFSANIGECDTASRAFFDHVASYPAATR